MPNSVFIIAAIVLLVLLALIAGLDTGIHFIRQEGKNKLMVFIYVLWGLVRLKKDINTDKLFRKRKLKKKKSIEDIYINVSAAIRSLLQDRKLIRLFIRTFHIKNIDVRIYPATGDACSTAVLTGAVMAIAGSIDSVLYNNIRIKKRDYRIQPGYNKNSTSLDILCIIKIRLANIIILGYAMYRYVLLKKKIKGR